MTLNIEYTETFAPLSSLVEGAYYNGNDNSLVLDLNDSLYRYENVPAYEVVNLVNASSPGRYYNTTFRNAYGPSEYIGEWDYATFIDVTKVKSDETVVRPTETVGMPKDLKVVDATNESSAEPTKEFSLNLPEPVRSDRAYEVFFNGGKSYNVKDANSVGEAVAALREAADMLGVSVTVEKVVVTFV